MKRMVRGFSEKMRIFYPRCRVHHLLLLRLALQATQPLHKGDVSQLIKFSKTQSPSASAVTIVTGFPAYGLNLPA